MSKVVILGAGASAGYDATLLKLRPPTTREFLRRAMELTNLPDDVWMRHNLLRDRRFNINKYSKVMDFLKHYYRMDRTALRDSSLDINIEEVLTFLDLDGNLSEVREELIRLMASVLDAVMVGYDCPHHKILAENLSPNDTIITFNWDLLLDNVLAPINEELPQQERYYDGCYMPNYGYLDIQGISGNGSTVQVRSNLPMLLKLHGSFNWLRCKKCKKVCAFMTLEKTGVRVYKGESIHCRQSGCDGLCEPIIIPQTLLKNYDDVMLLKLWEKAGEVIQSSDEIIVVGYSLPPTDFKTKWLFMKATADDRPRKIRIYDLCPEKLKERFAAAFHVPTDDLECIQGGIKEASEQAKKCNILSD